jgi:hypothetical protein
MASRGRPTLQKRLREQQREQRRRDKEQRREERRREREDTNPGTGGANDVDPDLAGIVPGPQRQPWMEDSSD